MRGSVHVMWSGGVSKEEFACNVGIIVFPLFFCCDDDV